MIDSTAEVPSLEERMQEAGKPRALVIVSERSAEVVRLKRQQKPLTVHINAIKEDKIEIVGPVFFPKNTQLELHVEGSENNEASERCGTIILRGVVGKVQMANAAPTYRIWVQLENFDPAILHALWIRCRASEEVPLDSNFRYSSSSNSAPSWAQRLVFQGVLLDTQLEKIVATSDENNIPLEAALVQAGLALEEQVAKCIAMELGVPFLDAHAFEILADNRTLLPLELTQKKHLFPLFNLNGTITLGMSNPTDLAAIDRVRLETNCQVEACQLTRSTIKALIAGDGRQPAKQEERPSLKLDEESQSLQRASSTIRMVRSIVEQCASAGASDIHVEPEQKQVRIRMRVDGVMREHSVHPPENHASIISRIKVMAKLDIAETRRPQDGHLSMELTNGKADIRVSTIPTVYGENVVLRLLISDGEVFGLEDLGMAEETHQKMEEFLTHPHGMILVTGPTGSGKTTTLYAALTRIATPERNVVTVEDPVEKRINFLRQTEVNPKTGVTFATGLRSILRQDPDVIMIGEIRDREAGELAVQAALTGHLVLSTLHTNDASGAIVRLHEMGIPPFLITSSLRAVVSQRLARKVCSACAREVNPDPNLLKGLGAEGLDGVRFMKGCGCGACLNSGYRGRVGIYEMLELNSSLRSALLGNASRSTIEIEANKALLCDLRSDGLRRVREGVTTLEEVARIVGLIDARSGDQDGKG